MWAYLFCGRAKRGEQITKLNQLVLVVVLVIFAAVILTACSKGAGEGRARGGSITIAESSNPDALDPALAYTIEASVVHWLVYPGLVTYRHAEGKAGTEIIPGAAESLPRVSRDGKTYTFTLREGLRYSDGTTVRASDFEHAIKRALTLQWGGLSFFERIVGVDAYIRADKQGADIRGIMADDRTRRITIELTQPDGQFLYVLAFPAAGLVPGSTPLRNLTADPPPGLGAYEFTKVDPNRQFSLAKNPRFNLPGIPKGNVDRITVKLIKNQARETQDVMADKLDWMLDEPAGDLLGEVRSKYRDRYQENVANSTYYFFLNVTAPPFDKLAVRQAVNYAVDKRALVRIFGGLLEPDCNFLPPNMPGYVKIDPCPWGDPNAAPNIARARRLVSDAGAGGAKVTVWGDDDERNSRATQYFADVLNKIGIDAKPRIIGATTFYQTVGNLRTNPQAGFANWFEDFPHPADFFFLLKGKSIQPTNNQNLSESNDPAVNVPIERLETQPAEPNAEAWAKLDAEVTGPKRAFVVAYGHSKDTTFMSSRMNIEDCSVYHPVYRDDLSQFCLKK